MNLIFWRRWKSSMADLCLLHCNPTSISAFQARIFIWIPEFISRLVDIPDTLLSLNYLTLWKLNLVTIACDYVAEEKEHGQDKPTSEYLVSDARDENCRLNRCHDENKIWGFAFEEVNSCSRYSEEDTHVDNWKIK